MALSLAEDKPTGPVKKTKWYRQLYFWVIVAIILGVLVGWLWPGFGEAMQPIGTTFVEAMRMLIGPIVFLTIIAGIASVANIKQVGSTGIKALIYFQCGTLIAMVTGLVAINLIPLGNGVNADVSTIETSDTVNALIEKGEDQQWWEFLTHIVPSSMVEPFVEGDILQIIFLAVIFGVALNAVGSKIGAPILDLVQRGTKVVFKVLSFIMKLAPLGAFGAMAYAIGKYGVSTLTSLGGLIALFYLTSAFFVLVVLGSVMGYLKLNIFKLLRYLKEELLLIVGTSTAEPALPGLMRKMEYAGAKKSIVGLVVPTGYSFNLDGAAIYLSLAAVYIAQATNANLTITQQIGLMAIMLLTSKGAAGVAGGGFIALAATLSTVGTIPAAGIMLIFGIDKFMSECRALVNFIGNAVATLFVAKWDKGLDVDRVRKVLNKEDVPDLPDEIDATENPLSIESTELVGAYTADFHHHEHAPKPEYSVDAVAQELAEAKAAGVPTQSVAADANGQHRHRRSGQHRPAARQRRPSIPAVATRLSSPAGGPHPGRQRLSRPTSAHPNPTRRHRRRRRDKVMKVLLAPDKFKGSLTAAEVVHHLGNGLAERGHQLHRAAARRRRGRQRRRPPSPPASEPSRSPSATPSVDEAPRHRRFRRHHRRHRGRQHLRAAHPARRDASPRSTPPAAASGEAIIRHAPTRRHPDRAGPGRIGQHRRRRRHARRARRRVPGRRRRPDHSIDGGTLQRIRSIDTTDLADLSQRRHRHRQRRAEPAHRTRRRRRRLRPAKGRHPGDRRHPRHRPAPPRRLLDRRRIPGRRPATPHTPGAGAAGGLGFAGLLLGGRTVSGADYFLDLLDFETHLQGCDLVITGEGRMDDQTLNGKLPAIIARRAGQIPVIAVVGRSDITPAALTQMGIQAVHAIADHTDRNPAGDPACISSGCWKNSAAPSRSPGSRCR